MKAELCESIWKKSRHECRPKLRLITLKTKIQSLFFVFFVFFVFFFLVLLLPPSFPSLPSKRGGEIEKDGKSS